MASGQDLVWVAGKPTRHGMMLPASLPAKPKSKQMPKPEVTLSQRCHKEPQPILSEESIASEHLNRNLTFSHLCQEDKNKIGALIRKLINLKAEHAQEAESAKNEKLKFNENLQAMQQRNLKIQHQTSELKNHFSSSLALLKIYKEKVHRQECEKADQDQKISDLTKELEKVKQELEKLGELQASAQSIRQSSSPANIVQLHESELATNVSDTVAERLAQENRRLQRLLDIQNSSRDVVKPAIELANRSSSDVVNPAVDKELSENRDPSQHPCKHCKHHEITAPVSVLVNDRSTSPDSVYEAHHDVANEDVSDDERALVKELNSHRLHVETLLCMHNDVSLLKALERISTGSADDYVPNRLDYKTDSDDEQLLKVLSTDLNRRVK